MAGCVSAVSELPLNLCAVYTAIDLLIDIMCVLQLEIDYDGETVMIEWVVKCTRSADW